MTPRQEELTAGWQDGSLTPAEQEELLQALKSDPGFARAFAEEVEIHRGLQFQAARSDEGDARAADRILHYLRADQEGTRFVENVKLRALAGGRRRRPTQPGTSAVGPAIAAAAALFVIALIGLLAYVSHSQKKAVEQDIAEQRRVETAPVEPPKPTPIAPKPAPIDDQSRKQQIDDDLRKAAEKPFPAPRPEEPKSPAPEPERKVAVPRPETPSKPAPSVVEAAPVLARIEKGVADAHGEMLTAGAELRDGVVLDGAVVLKFADGTSLEVKGEVKLHEKLQGKRAAGRAVTLNRGYVIAEVAKQPASMSFLFLTPHAEVQVVGTKLSVQAGAETRVDVQEGQVRVTSLKGGQVSTLSAGQGLELGAGAPRGYLSGLRASYYDTNTYKGVPLERADRGIELVLDAAKNELPPVGTDRNFGVRWEGRFLAETDGEYVFILSVDGHVRFVFEGQEVVADKKDYFHGIQRSIVRRKLAPGWHDLLVEYGDDDGSSRCTLRYVPPDAKLPDGETFQRDDSGWAIPPRLFSHTRK